MVNGQWSMINDQWSSMVINGHQWSSMVINEWSSMNGHQ